MAKPTYDKVDEVSDYQFARLRTEMFFGSREITEETIVGFDGQNLVPQKLKFVPALATYFREIVDNALDEIIGHGHGNRIDVTFDPEKMIFSVQDNGRGVPGHLVETVFTKARAGRNFRERGNVAGTNGVGAATTCFTSTYFKVETWHGNKHHSQMFKENDVFDNLSVEKPIVKRNSSKSGTYVEFQPSPKVYPHMILPEEFVRARMYEISAVNPGIKVFYNGGQIKLGKKLKDAFFNGVNPAIIEIEDEFKLPDQDHRAIGGQGAKMGKFSTTFYIVPNFDDGPDEKVHSIVNNICAYNGGSHITAFKSVFYNGLIDELKGESRRRKLTLAKQDIAPGLLIYNVTNMTGPNFDSQSKTKLTNSEADRLVRRGFDSAMFKKVVKQNKDWIEEIYKRCAIRLQKQDASDAEKLQKEKAKVKVAKLNDAIGQDRRNCVLIISEGDSAASPILQVRDPKVIGTLPLRGKIMNVTGKTMTKVMQSEPLTDMMKAIGLKIGTRAARNILRYGKVYIACDEDEDGKNIFALLVNFFYSYWPELFDPNYPPFIYKFNTPLLILKKGKERKYIGSGEYSSFNLADWKGWEITRAKGLARLENVDWKNVLKSPSITPVTDDGEIQKALSLIFEDGRADDRKIWLGEG